MLTSILAISLALISQSQPAEIHAAALADLMTIPQERRRDTRYLSLHAAAPGEEREKLYRATLFALNSTSFRTNFAKPLLRYNDVLIRLSLSSLGWDSGSRTARIDRLKTAGVDVSGFKADLWEEFTGADPYFGVSTNINGDYRRGWVDPKIDDQLRVQTYSSRALLRADWLIRGLLLEAQDRGYYSQALLLPSKEADLYKCFGVNIALIDSDPQLRVGGAVLDSVVALHNRELQLLPSLYGRDDRFIWRTYDFASDATGDKSVLERFAGTVRHDGREIIGTLPNGLHWYYLANGEGAQVNVVPQAIAIDQRSGAFERLKDRSVVNAYKCMSCHGPASGIQPFSDVVGDAILSPGVGLAVFAYGKERQSVLRESIEDYYLIDLPTRIQRQNASYTQRVKECNGLDPATNGNAVNEIVESYIYGLVTPEQAAQEMGQDLAGARTQWRASGNSYLVLLAAGKPIRRAAWESAFPDAMRTVTYPWENNGKP